MTAPAREAPASSARGGTRAVAIGPLLLGWAGVSWGIAHVNGYWSPWALLLLLLGAAAATAGALGRGVDARLALGVVGGLLVATPVLHHQAQHPHAGGPAYGLSVLLAGVSAAGLGGLLLIAAVGRVPPRAALPVVALLALAADLAVVRASPEPAIDVHTLLQHSADGLTRGDDLYRETWPDSTGLTDVYPYLPATTLLLAPARWLLGDVRLGLVGCLAGSAVLLARLAGQAPRVSGPLARALPVLPALVLAFPRATLLAQDSWTEPLLLLLLIGAVSCTLAGRHAAAVLLVGLALASKQHVALLLPLAAWWPAFGWRRALASSGVALAVVAPWLLAGPGDLWHDAVQAPAAFPVLPQALDLPAGLSRVGLGVGFWLTAVALAAAYALCWRLPRDETGFAVGSAIVLLAVALANKQSFFNHYTLVAGLLVLGVVLAARRGGAP